MGRDKHLFWAFSKEFSLRVEAPSFLGVYTQEDALCRGAYLTTGEAGSYEEGNKVHFSFLLDSQGIVLDALFTAFGDPLLVGSAEYLCEKSVRKHYQAARKIGKDELEVFAFGKALPSSSKVKRAFFLVLEARDRVCDAVSLPSHSEEGGERFPAWETLSNEERLKIVRTVVEEVIDPYLKRDGGGLEVVECVDTAVRVIFQGACVHCFASSGSTLSYIQHVLRLRVHPDLVVEPALHQP